MNLLLRDTILQEEEIRMKEGKGMIRPLNTGEESWRKSEEKKRKGGNKKPDWRRRLQGNELLLKSKRDAKKKWQDKMLLLHTKDERMRRMKGERMMIEESGIIHQVMEVHRLVELRLIKVEVKIRKNRELRVDNAMSHLKIEESERSCRRKSLQVEQESFERNSPQRSKEAHQIVTVVRMSREVILRRERRKVLSATVEKEKKIRGIKRVQRKLRTVTQAHLHLQLERLNERKTTIQEKDELQLKVPLVREMKRNCWIRIIRRLKIKMKAIMTEIRDHVLLCPGFIRDLRLRPQNGKADLGNTRSGNTGENLVLRISEMLKIRGGRILRIRMRIPWLKST
jgi:hypothetical protein